MRSLLVSVALASAVTSVGCASDQTASSGSRFGNTGVVAPAANAGRGAVSPVASGAAGSGFGNSTSTPTVGPTHPLVDAGQTLGDGSPCVAGKFCASSNPDQGCGTLTLKSTVKMTTNPGNVLIIFDRSTSMNEQWNGMPKWQAAGTAVLNALMPDEALLTVGAELFPSPDNNTGSCVDPTGITCLILGGDPTQFCNVNPITAPDEVTFKPAAMAINELQTGANGMPKYMPVGATPTAEAVQQADMALKSASLTGNTIVFIITDGEPNCNWDQNATVNTIMGWLTMKNIKTYVIGLPGAGMGNGPAVLNALAQAGGTMMYFTPDDAMALQMSVHDAVSQTITSGFDSCSIDLMPATDTPDKLQLVVTEPATPNMEESVPHDLGGSAGGWSITSDGSHVTLTGGLCDSAKSGKLATLTFKFGCKDIPPIPPSHVS